MIDYLRSKYADSGRDEERVAIVRPDEDEENRISCAWSMYLVFLYVAFISLIVYGALHLKDCPAENMLAISFIVIGCLGLLIKIIDCPYDLQGVLGMQDARRNKALKWINFLLSLIVLGWMIAHCYWTFKLNPDTKPEDHDKPNYCDLEFYRNAYWGSIFFLSAFGMMFLCTCGVVCLAYRET